MMNFADCTSDSKIISCKVKKSEQAIKNYIKLINYEKNTYLKWTNLPEIVNMYITYEIIS